MDVITGTFEPQGKLPFALANRLQAVIDNDPTRQAIPRPTRSSRSASA